MPEDIQYREFSYKPSEIEHAYGDKVHIINNPYIQSLLAKFSTPAVTQPLLNTFVKRLYSHLLTEVVSTCFPTEEIQWETRMKHLNENAVLFGRVVDQDCKVISVDLARAGTWPSHLCYDELNYYLKPENLRQDHFHMNRKVNEQNEVIGVDVAGSKIGGGQDGAYVLFPDPMGATGGSMSYVVSHFKEHVEGVAAKYISMHLIITPEYIRHMTEEHPDLEIFALRLDRGLSDKDVLNSVPGTFPDRERGLNEIQYIVPGAGGVGEILNNSFV
jgi:uracil phosphoribosyltransferase